MLLAACAIRKVPPTPRAIALFYYLRALLILILRGKRIIVFVFRARNITQGFINKTYGIIRAKTPERDKKLIESDGK